MKSVVCLSLAASLAVAGAASAQPFYMRGQFNGWGDPTGHEMTSLGGNAFTKTYTIGASATATTMPASTIFDGKAANIDYSTEGPEFGGNIRFRTPASGSITFTFFNQNSWSDGWQPDNRRRIGYTGTTYGWELMGSFNGWSTPFSMTNSGDVWETSIPLTAGTNYEFKFRNIGNWDVSAGNGFAENGGNLNFTPDTSGTYFFRLDQANGRYQFVIPAPGAAALLGLGGLVAARRRRN